MGVLNVYHPDIEEFITCKSNPDLPADAMVRFNLSVMIDDDFMEAVDDDSDVMLHFPVYNEQGEIERDPDKWQYSKKVSARELWDKIIERAYMSGEPGVLFYDNLNDNNNTWYCENIVATNPCSEFVSGFLHDDTIGTLTYKSVTPEHRDISKYKGTCNLGSLFLKSFLLFDPATGKFRMDYSSLQYAIRVGVRMLDKIIDKTYFPHKDYEGYQKNMRAVGMGITGLADVLALLGMRYGSDAAVSFTSELMRMISATAYQTSAMLADEKGPFPFYDKKFLESRYLRNCNESLMSNRCDNFDSLKEKMAYEDAMADIAPLKNEWKKAMELINEYGVRNARLLSIAPTGTLSQTFGSNCSSGLEPIYMLSMERDVKLGGQDESNIKHIVVEDAAWRWYKELKEQGQKLAYVDDNCFVAVDDTTATSKQITVDEHISMLAAVAKYVDMSCSKTINIPTDYSFEDTKEVYMRAWDEGIKGCTIFRPNEFRAGIFRKVENKTEETQQQTADVPQEPVDVSESSPKRGEVVRVSDNVIGRERHLQTGCGTLHFQAFFDPDTGDLLETYASKGSMGGCNSFMVGLSRMISLSARAGVSVDNIVDQLLSAPACTSYTSAIKNGECTSRGLCCPAAMGHALKGMHDQIKSEILPKAIHIKAEDISDDALQQIDSIATPTVGQLRPASSMVCPDCGSDLIFEGGCNICKACGWSKCG